MNRILKTYIVQLVSGLRNHFKVYLGASPRGSLALFRGAQALAAMEGRDFVVPDDIKLIARWALPHRIILRPEAQLDGTNPGDVVAEVLARVSVPVEG